MSLRVTIGLNETELKTLLLMSKVASDMTWTEPTTKQAMKDVAARLQRTAEINMPFLKSFVEDKGGLGDF